MGLMAGDGHNRHKRPNRLGVMAGDRLNRPNRLGRDGGWCDGGLL